jgi:hypothetical protein
MTPRRTTVINLDTDLPPRARRTGPDELTRIFGGCLGFGEICGWKDTLASPWTYRPEGCCARTFCVRTGSNLRIAVCSYAPG